MLSQTAKYAIKALHCISVYGSIHRKMTALEVAELTNIPKPFLSKLLKQLVHRDLISSLKGPNGGFYLTKEQLEQSVMDIITVVEGKDSFQQCVLNFEHCNAANPCPIHDFVSVEKEGLRKAIRSVKLLDMMDNLNYFANEKN